jgi:hypothetical protein
VISHDSYLTEPAEALGRCPAPACGGERVLLSIAGLEVELSGLNLAQLARARREYEDAIIRAPYAPPLELVARTAHASWFRPTDLAGAEYRIALSHDARGAWVSGLHFFARFERGPRARMTLWVDPSTVDDFEGALVNSLRVLVAHGLLARGGVMLHSAAVESAGRAYLFFGPSGAGKSTLSRISAGTGRAVISDELNALVPSANGYAVLALPFSGDFGRTPTRRASVPLAHIFRLRQAPVHAVAELPRAQAIATLLAACPYVNSDPVVGDLALSKVQSLVTQLCPHELGFTLDAGFWSLVECPPTCL